MLQRKPNLKTQRPANELASNFFIGAELKWICRMCYNVAKAKNEKKEKNAMSAKKITLTEQQQAVVENRGGNLLVSAAAGAGKTKVLVDRIMDRICGEEQCNITDFLVITFTKAAAAELRAKITAELSKRLTETPNDEHIRKQMHLIYAAKISTVHSFCSDMLRSHAALAGIPADFRVGEEQESKVLRASAMEDTLENLYKIIETHPNIKAFVEDLAAGRDDSAVPAILFNVYDVIQSHAWPAEWAKQCMDAMSVDVEQDAIETPWGAYIIQNTKEYIMSQLPLAMAAQEVCDASPALCAAYGPTIADDIRMMKDMLEVTSWDSMILLKNREWMRMKPVKKVGDYSEADKTRVTELRKRYKKNIEARLNGMYGMSSVVLDDIKKTEASVRGMFELVDDFAKRYTAKKEAHNMLDFSDLEHYSIRMLVDAETHEPTEAAVAISKQFVEIMVDEYQDTNGVQETIFNAISNGQNLFMVGDVKQSIYQFRQADPSIFLSHYNTYKSYVAAKENEPRKILLTKNFRSRPEILDATNAVMRTCMSPIVGGINYTVEEELVAGREDFAEPSMAPVELNVINMDDIGATSDENEEAVAKVDIEAKYVAKRIRDMLDNDTIQDEETGEQRKVTANDIAILMQAHRRPAAHYIKALAEQGIAAKAVKNASIMETTEIATLFCYLQIIDNPMQDVPLVSVLASPLCGFTADELAQVRIAKKDAKYFFHALQEYAKGSKKTQKFLDQYQYLRELSTRTKLSRLFMTMLETTDALDVFASMGNGDQRAANIHKFEEMIAKYEAGGARGLFGFLCYIEALQEQGAELPQAACSTADEAVTIMSIHSSKGLEFPIVFLSDLSRKFNTSDLKATALLHKELGAGVQVLIKRPDAPANRYPTIARNAISAKNAAEAKSEHLRILYVAMTRAKQKLVMTYCDKMDRTMQRLGNETMYPLPEAVSQSVSNLGHWVLMTAMCRDDGYALQRLAGVVPTGTYHSEYPWAIDILSAAEIGGKTMKMSEIDASMEETEAEEDVFEEPYEALDSEAISADLQFSYAHTAATHTPAKAVATALANHQQNISIRRPVFVKEKKGFTAAERGTATHTFMQYANFHKCWAEGKAGIQSEISRLVMEKFVTSDMKDAIMTEALEHLFKSPVGKELAEQKNIRREFEFTILVPATELYGEEAPEDNIVLEGVVDMFSVKEDGIHLYDFKTDYIENEEAMKEKATEYKPQLDIYAKALNTIYHKPIVERNIIFVRNGEKVPV